MNKIINFLRSFAIFLISFYQRTLSPDHGIFKTRHPYGFCRFYPSCSEYTKRAIVKFGIISGLWMGMKRVLRCNPWSKPAIDLISGTQQKRFGT